MNINRPFAASLMILGGFWSLGASAHSFSVHAHMYEADYETSAVTNIGWGHALPMNDFFQGDMIESYDLYEPDGSKHPLAFDRTANARGEDLQEIGSATIQSGDAFVNKITFNKDAPKGTRQIAATMKQTTFSVWVDAKGKEKWGGKTMDKIEGAQKFIFSANFKNFAKAFAPMNGWTEPKPVGHALEIIPLTDLSKVKAGDKVSFRVLLAGKPLAPDDKGEPKLSGFGEFYGMGDTYEVGSRLTQDGVATIEIPKPGRWQVSVSTISPVGPDNHPELVGKVLSSGYTATATFVVRPD